MGCYIEFAKVYDKLINCDIDYESWGKFILELCNEKNLDFSNYLDLACGTGNMAQQLSSSFHDTWLVDMSMEMLSEAEAKLRNMGIKAKYVCQDIRELNLNMKFDLITCCLDSTNYLLSEEDLQCYFMNVRHHLKDNGVFIFDINSYYKITEILGNNVYNYDDSEVTYIWENSLNDEIVDMFLTFFVRDGEMYRRFDEEHSERAYRDKTIETLLKSAGLEVLYKFDNYDNKQIDEQTERIVYVVKIKEDNCNG
ncbi:MAG: class I SAM-dependent DNA methyltransferase [Solirubrobacterales bacterium]